MKNVLFVLVALVALIFVAASPLRETVAEAHATIPTPASAEVAVASEPPTPVLARTGR